MSLPDPFLESVLEKIDSPDVIGIGIVGSYTRGQEGRYSDGDFDIFVINNTLWLIKEVGI